MPPRPGAWGVSAIPTAFVALCVAMGGMLALQLSQLNAARRIESELPGMELRRESRSLHEAIEATAQFFKTQRLWPLAVIASPSLAFAWRSRSAVPWLVPPTPKRKALSWCCATSRAADLQLGSGDWYGMKLLRRL